VWSEPDKTAYPARSTNDVICYYTGMKLYAISDLHLGFPANRDALDTLQPHPDDWLILAGDIGESTAHLELTFRKLGARFARLFWVPGNHELWTTNNGGPRGEEKYRSLVKCCRDFGVLTPEDPFALWEGEGGPCTIAPLFLLYDYSFRPEDVDKNRALAWAAESGILCADERYLHPDPHPSVTAWCEARCAEAESRLSEASRQHPLVLVNHFPAIPGQGRGVRSLAHPDHRLGGRRALRGSFLGIPETMAEPPRYGCLPQGNPPRATRRKNNVALPVDRVAMHVMA
jgi:hypothetical protein